MYDSKKLIKMFKNITLQSIAVTKSFIFNKNNIVTKCSRILYLLNVYSIKMTSLRKNNKWDNELKVEFKNLINRLNNLRTFWIEIIDFLKRLLDNDVSIKREISILNANHESFNWTNYFDDNCIIHFLEKIKNDWDSRTMTQSNDELNECLHDTWQIYQY